MRLVATTVGLALLFVPTLALADRPSDETSGSIAKDVKDAIPNLAFAYTAGGVAKGTFGVQAYGADPHAGGGSQESFLAGGGAIWASPIDRVTFVADASRNLTGNFTPSVAGIVRLVGPSSDGLTFGVLGKLKVEGFGAAPGGEMEAEAEVGLLLSGASASWHGDLNAIAGFDADGGELDGEVRARLGRDLGRLVRLGIDGQVRYSAGRRSLPGGRAGDFIVGPQVLLGTSHFYASFTGGPSTVGVPSSLGWASIIAIGGAT
ncbi:MAG: hypothetical protein ABI678_02505 [Kofleriaceae bacterium]